VCVAGNFFPEGSTGWPLTLSSFAAGERGNFA